MGSVADACRGVAVFIKDGMKADFCYDLNKTLNKESVWCEIAVDSKDKERIWVVYKSPNCEARNQEMLNKLITQEVERGYKHTVIVEFVGDFNFPEINWESWSVSSSETHPAFKFIVCLGDNFLFQHVHSNTRHRFGQEPSCLDLVLSDKEEIIENLKIGDKLGASDHSSILFNITFNITCPFEKEEVNQQRPNFYKADYRLIREYLSQVDKSEMKSLNTEDLWNFFVEKIQHCIDDFVPLRRTCKNFKIPKWMDH